MLCRGARIRRARVLAGRSALAELSADYGAVPADVLAFELDELDATSTMVVTRHTVIAPVATQNQPFSVIDALATGSLATVLFGALYGDGSSVSVTSRRTRGRGCSS